MLFICEFFTNKKGIAVTIKCLLQSFLAEHKN